MPAATWRTRLHRWRWWLVAAGVLIAIRVALPEILRRVIISQASQHLHARVDVGDVDLRLWRGGVALEDVAIRAADAPAPPPPPEDADPEAPPPPFDEYSPILGFQRLAVELRYLPLFSRTIQIRELTLNRPRVALDRLASGDLNVMALVPAGTETAEPTPVPTPEAAAEGDGWKVGLDQFLLTDGRIRFRDFALEGSEPVELGIDRIAVEEVALTPAVYGKPGAILLKLGLDEGVIDVFSRLTLEDGVATVSTELKADRLPLRRARLYVPRVGWSDLKGELDLDLTYDLEPEARNALRGTLALRDVSVAVPTLEDVAVGWSSLAVDIEEVDLLAQRARVRSVALDGPQITVQLQGDDLLPALAQRAAGTAAPDATPPAETTAPADPTATTAADTPSADPSPATAAPAETATPADPTPPAAADTPPMESSPATAAPTDTTAPADPTPTADAGTPPAETSPTSTETPPLGDAAVSQSDVSPAAAAPADAMAARDPTPTGDAETSPETSPTQTETPRLRDSAVNDSDESDSDTPPPWSWDVADIAIRDGTVRIRSKQPPLDIGVAVTAKNLSSADDAVGHATVQLAVAPGTLALDGDVRIAPVPAFGGTLKIADLPLPPLVAISGALPPEALPSAALRSDLAIAAGLPPAAGGEAAADRLRVSGTLGIADLQAAPPQVPGLGVELQDLELRLDQVVVPGVIPPGAAAPAGSAIELAAGLTLTAAQVVRTDEAPLNAAVQQLVLTVPALTVPAALAGLAPRDGVPVITGGLGVELAQPRVALGADDTVFTADRVALAVPEVALPVAPPAADAAPAADALPAPPLEGDAPPSLPLAAPPLTLDVQLELDQASLATAQGKELNAGLQRLALQLSDVSVPGFVAGAPPAPTTEPLQAKGTLQLTQARVARGDGKEFTVAARTIALPIESLAVPGVPGGLPAGAPPQPVRASLGAIRIEQPAIRVTRTEQGLVLPAAAAADAPAAPGDAATPAGTAAPTPAATAAPEAQATANDAPGAPLELQVASLRVLRGGLEVTDRAVKPAFSSRFAPIEIDARGIRLPGPVVKPLNVDIHGVGQGRITVRGSLSPQESDLKLEIDELPLVQFNPYATTYSSYGIADGALSITSTATARGERFEVKNDITLHQFDLTGAEGDSLFEENFGIPLTLALALLRDVKGDIDLGVPLAVDRAGKTEVDVMGVVRSALKQAIAGAVTSPLKMLGAVAGGKNTPVAPAPIAFRLGRAEPTSAGAESAARLADFLVARPAMGVRLSTAPTTDDARWLHEQSLRDAWEEEGFFARSLAFVVARGPRQRIRAYLDARASDEKPELSAEDTATLDEWLAERPAPTPAELQALAAARLAAVEKVLAEKGIDAARIARDEPAAEPATGAPVVAIQLQSAARLAAGPSGEDTADPGAADDDQEDTGPEERSPR